MLLTLALALALVLPAGAITGTRSVQADYNNIKVMLNGAYLQLTDADGKKVEPFAVAGTTYLPVRAVAGALGLGVNWNSTTSTVQLTSGGAKTTSTTQTPPAGTKGSQTLQADYSNIQVSLNGNRLLLTDADGKVVEPFAVAGTTYLPVRAVADALNLAVEWRASTTTVVLTSQQESAPITSDDAINLVKGNLDEIYLGKWTQAYLDMVGSNPTRAQAAYDDGMEISADLFLYYWDIFDSIDDASETFRQEAIELQKKISAKSTYLITGVTDKGDGSFEVKVQITPLNVMQQVGDALETYAPMVEFFNKYTQEQVNAMDEAGYQAYSEEYGRIIFQLTEEKLAQAAYLPAQILPIRVEKNSLGVYTINDEDWGKADELIIVYP